MFALPDCRIEKLEPRQGGYLYARVGAEWLRQHFGQAGRLRLLCALDGGPPYRCGLSHLGDGDFFLILSAAKLKPLGKGAGDGLRVALALDPDPLGVDLPEVLEMLLAQDPALQAAFARLAPGRRRNVAFQVQKIKDLDRQVAKALELLGG